MNGQHREDPLIPEQNESTIARPGRLWRVFYTTPRAEKKCEERLLAQQLEVFLPKCIVVRQWKDRKKKVVEPLFNNYIFAQVDELERLSVLRTPGIVRSIGFGGTPAVVSDAEIEQLQIAQKDPRRLTHIPYPMPNIGALVTVTEGPLPSPRFCLRLFSGSA